MKASSFVRAQLLSGRPTRFLRTEFDFSRDGLTRRRALFPSCLRDVVKHSSKIVVLRPTTPTPRRTTTAGQTARRPVRGCLLVTINAARLVIDPSSLRDGYWKSGSSSSSPAAPCSSPTSTSSAAAAAAPPPAAATSGPPPAPAHPRTHSCRKRKPPYAASTCRPSSDMAAASTGARTCARKKEPKYVPNSFHQNHHDETRKSAPILPLAALRNARPRVRMSHSGRCLQMQKKKTRLCGREVRQLRPILRSVAVHVTAHVARSQDLAVGRERERDALLAARGPRNLRNGVSITRAVGEQRLAINGEQSPAARCHL